MATPRILVVDDQPDLRDLVCTVLERAGMDPLPAVDGESGLKTLYAHRPDLVVLDVTMPGLDGWQTLGRIRELSDVPVLMLTARDTEMEKVRGLRSGADDYVTKPFGRQELIARVETLLRRGMERVEERGQPPYDDGLVQVDWDACRVTVGGEEVFLTPLEFKLLGAFVRHPRQVLSSDQLGELVWDETLGASRDQVKVYVGYLRRKLAQGTEDELVETVRGFGYRWSPPGAPANGA
jgi:DNA-binding response OmpR family regulator